jgi:hypothetical protein
MYGYCIRATVVRRDRRGFEVEPHGAILLGRQFGPGARSDYARALGHGRFTNGE